MTFAEFRRWALECHGYQIGSGGQDQALRAAWIDGGPRVEGGTGHRATYGSLQQRRLALWLRCYDLIDKMAIATWIHAGENRDTGWLINQGDGIWWTEDPEVVAEELARTGFVAVKCGAEP